MPELPEVESVRRQLAPELVGRRILDIWVDPQERFSDLHLLSGRRLESLDRRGKFLIADLDAPLQLIAHLGMTGSFHLDRPDAWTRARLALDDGRELDFRDPRRFGRLSVVPEDDWSAIPTLATLGPEPLSDAFDPDRFARDLARTTASVKAALLGQRLVAGVGNIYADEALWRARIHPSSRRVGRGRARLLHGAIRDVLAAAIEREGTTFSTFRGVNGESGRYVDQLDAYGQAGLPCARCGTPLRRAIVAQRGTTYCPRCQRA